MAFRILWIDDNIEELRSHVVYLGEKGYEVEGVTNGVDGVETLREKNFDAVLLDEMMPGMTSGRMTRRNALHRVSPRS